MVLVAASAVVVPSLHDARRVCDVLVRHGAGLVLVFGSVAKGTADQNSDIDMVAVFDDLGDYSCRQSVRGRLQHGIDEVTKTPVDVWVTDRPEWQHRTTKVSSSFEAAVISDAIVLYDHPASSDVNWDKEIAMPANNYDEALERLHDTKNALSQVLNGLYESARERLEKQRQDTRLWADARYERMASLCADSQKTIECAFKAVICLIGTKAARTHSIADLAEAIPDRYNNVTAPAMSRLNRIKPSAITLWHTAGPYSKARPALTLEEIEDTAIELAHMAHTTAAALTTHFASHTEAVSDLAHIVTQTETALTACDIGQNTPRSLFPPKPRDHPNLDIEI